MAAMEVLSTVELLARARGGDDGAMEEVFARSIPLLKRWASGRLPRYARAMLDTDDLVQETVVATLRRIDIFECRGDGALQAYLRQAVMNRIRNELRRNSRQAATELLDSDAQASGLSPLEELIGQRQVDAYERALAQLEPHERELIIARLELSLGYAEIAQATGRPSPDAARMAVGRAFVRLAALLKADR